MDGWMDQGWTGGLIVIGCDGWCQWLVIVICFVFAESLAASVSSSAGVYFVPAFSGLYAPYWQTDARGWEDKLSPDSQHSSEVDKPGWNLKIADWHTVEPRYLELSRRGFEIARLASNFWSNSLIPKINKYQQLVTFCICSSKSGQSDFAFITRNTSIHFSAFSTSCQEVPWLHYLTDVDQCFFETYSSKVQDSQGWFEPRGKRNSSR